MNDRPTLQPMRPAPVSPYATPYPPQVAAGQPHEQKRRKGAVLVVLLVAIVLAAMVGGGFVAYRSATGSTQFANVAASKPAAAADKGPTTTAGDSASTDTTDAADQTPSTDAPVSADDVSDAPAPAPVPKSGTPSNGGSNGGAAKTPVPAGPAVAVTSVNAPTSFDCHNGNSQTFTLSWTTANATKVTVAGKSVGPNGSTSLTFQCPGPMTFTVVAQGADGRTASKSVTITGRNIPKPSTDDDQPAPATPKAGGNGATTTTAKKN